MSHYPRRTRPKMKLAHSLLAGAVSILPATPAFAQTWTGATDNNWFTASNWDSGSAPNSASAAVVINSGVNNPVLLNANAAVSTLTLGAGDSLNQTAGVLTVAGGSILNAGSVALGSQLQLSNDLILSGAGGMTLNGGQIGGDGYGRTLTNQSTILGAGIIGSNSGALYQNISLNNSGVIDANTSGATLYVVGTGAAMTNSNLLEATGGGIVDLAANAPLTNAGGVILASGAGSSVLVNMQVQGGTLTTASGGSMATGGGAYLNGATANGAVTISNGSTYAAGASGLTQASGALDLGTGAGPGATLALSGQLQVTGADLTLAGPGTVVMSGGQIGGDGYARTLTNALTIQGSGVIGSNSGALYQGGFSLNNTGVIDANAPGSGLTIQVGGGVMANTGLLEATNGGALTLATGAPVTNGGGVITASGAGSTVLIDTEVQGGTFNTSGGGVIATGTGAYLDGATANGAITISNGSVYTAGISGLTQAAGTLDLGTGSGPGATLALTGSLQVRSADLTLAGPGLVTMSGAAQIGGDGYARTLNNQVTIAGAGVIGSNAGALYQVLSLNNTGTINANSAGNTLYIQGTGGTMINANLLEATGGGVLDLAANAPLTNMGGVVMASGAGSSVLVNTQIQGGTLTTADGGSMSTGASGAYLNGASPNGAITFTNGSTYTAASGMGLTQVAGLLNLGTGGGPGATLALSGQLQMTSADLTLAGPGKVVMASGQIGGDGYARTLNNQVTIEGSGLIGSNSGALYRTISLNNTGVIDANVSGATLSVQGSGATVNGNLMEATGGGILDLATGSPISNGGAAITASGAGSLVLIDTQIQGGVLTTSGGGAMQTGVNGAFLNGSVSGPITISDGSTYTAGSAALTRVAGAIDLGTVSGGTLDLTGALQMVGDLTLSGPGALAMSAGSQIGGDGYARTLTNAATIQGAGLVGSNAGALYSNLTVVNQAAGTLLADISGQTLTIGATGGLTNNGVMQANAGATLNATQGFTNFSGGALNGGTYNMYSGVVQINALGTTGGEIATNNAHILLDGAAASLADGAGLNALSGLSTNASGASLTVQGGNAFASTAPTTFVNNGAVAVGAASTFTTAADYSQSGAASSTLVDGTLTPGSGTFTLASGLLTGSGSVAAAVANIDGVVNPGDTVGTLQALSYTQGSGGTLTIQIAGASSYDVLKVQGGVTLDGLLNPIFVNGFTPTLGQSFTFLDYTSRSGMFASIANAVFDGGLYMWGVTYNSTDAILTVQQGPSGGGGGGGGSGGGGVSAAPEPSTWALMLMGVAGMGLALRRARRAPRRTLKAAAV